MDTDKEKTPNENELPEARMETEAAKTTMDTKVDDIVKGASGENDNLRKMADEIKGQEGEAIKHDIAGLGEEIKGAETDYNNTVNSETAGTETASATIETEKPQPSSEAGTTKEKGESSESSGENKEGNDERKEEGSEPKRTEIGLEKLNEGEEAMIRKGDEQSLAKILEVLKRNGAEMPDKIENGKLEVKSENGILGFFYKSKNEHCGIIVSFSEDGKNIIFETGTISDKENPEEALESPENFIKDEYLEKFPAQEDPEYETAMKKLEGYEDKEYKGKENIAKEFLDKYRSNHGADHEREQEGLVEEFQKREMSKEFKKIQDDFRKILEKVKDIGTIEDAEDIAKANEFCYETAKQLNCLANFLEINCIKSADEDMKKFVEELLVVEVSEIEEIRRQARILEKGVKGISVEELKGLAGFVERHKNVIAAFGIGTMLGGVVLAIMAGKLYLESQAGSAASAAAASGGKAIAYGLGSGAGAVKAGAITVFGKVIIPGAALAAFYTLFPEHKRDGFVEWLTGVKIPPRLRAKQPAGK